VCVWAALALVAVLAAQPARAERPVVGQPAPNFEITTVDGRKLSLSDLKGEVVVLNFWATWCAACRYELPLLDAYYQGFGPMGLRVFAVNTEESLPLSQLRPVVAGLKIPVIRHLTGPYRSLGALPTNYVIDRAGVLRYAKAAVFTEDVMNSVLGPLMRQPMAAGAPAIGAARAN
jgi:thiol-disulfide isomerase/thioredoxin